ncbi:MAG: molybdopterin-dependent oxidoreductase, partial [Coriobacteriales bacterium]|nr:molybdopterin-dependent oxidoreductase [Coriobacteriales bacterium]
MATRPKIDSGIEAFNNDLDKPWQFEEDGYTVTRGCAWSAPGCHPVGCGIKFYVNEDGILEKVEGDENQPITQGRLCVRCLTLPDMTYHPDRVIYPMKRAFEDRGKNKWERITWDEAYEIIETNIKDIKEKYGPESIVVFGGTGREGGPMCGPYGQAMLGTPNSCYTQSGYACYIPRVAAATFVTGATYPEMDYAGGLPGRYDDPMYKVPEVMMTWGKEPLPSNGDGFFGHSVIDCMKRGSKLISVDPHTNWLATRAVYHLPLRPGTDAALGMAMLNIIISEELYDKEFVSLYCYGFEQLAERVATMPPEKAAEICGVDVEDIYGATRMYANAQNAAILWGLAIDQKANGAQAGHCILALEAITGNLDVPGGQLLGDVTDSLADLGFGWSSLGPELQNKIIGLKEYPAYVAIVLNSHADLTLEAMETGEPYEIHAGFIASTNLLAGTCAAQPKRWHDAMQKLDFVFAADCWITPTIQCCADVILPLATFAERESGVAVHYGASPNMTGSVVNAVQVGETKGDLEIQYEIGRRIMPDNYAKFPTLYDFMEEFRFGNNIDYNELKEEVTRQRKVTYKKYELGLLRPDRKRGFNTPTGRVELYSTMFQ